jgi:hypothetical protein
MSHVLQTRPRPAGWLRAHRLVTLAALLALVAAATVAIVLAIGGNASTSPVNATPTSASSTISGPDESRIAATIGSARERSSTGGPDEAAVAGAIAGD